MKNVTIITLFLFLSINLQGQILTETFESGTFPPTGWITMEDALDSDDAIDIQWSVQEDFEPAYGTYGWAHTGNYSAISSFGFFDQYAAYLITPQFTPTAANHELHLFYKQAYTDDYNGQFKVMVSSGAQNVLTDFTEVFSIDEANAPTNFEELVVDLSAYIGTPIYVAFVNYDDDGDGDEWYIDDVTMEPVPVPGPTLNPTPADGATDISITNTQTSEINLSWDPPTTGGTVDQYDLWFGVQPNDLDILGHPTSMSATPKTFHFNTTYYWKAAAVNMSGESSDVWSFTTCDFPTVTAPYSIDFENAGFVPDGMDQSVDNGNKFWHFVNDPTASSHIGNAGDTGGTQSASGGYFAFVSDYGTPSPNGTIMYTPKIDLSSLSNPAISVYILSNNEGSLNVTYTIEAFNGTDWVPIFTNNTNTAGWEEKIIILSYHNIPEQTQFRFVVTEPSGSDNKDDFAMDDFVIDERSNLSNKEFAIENIEIYPNPVVDYLYIKLPGNQIPAKVELFDITGKLILRKHNTGKIDMSNLPKGNYLINIYNDKNISVTQKIIK